MPLVPHCAHILNVRHCSSSHGRQAWMAAASSTRAASNGVRSTSRSPSKHRRKTPSGSRRRSSPRSSTARLRTAQPICAVWSVTCVAAHCSDAAASCACRAQSRETPSNLRSVAPSQRVKHATAASSVRRNADSELCGALSNPAGCTGVGSALCPNRGCRSAAASSSADRSGATSSAARIAVGLPSGSSTLANTSCTTRSSSTCSKKRATSASSAAAQMSRCCGRTHAGEARAALPPAR